MDVHLRALLFRSGTKKHRRAPRYVGGDGFSLDCVQVALYSFPASSFFFLVTYRAGHVADTLLSKGF